MYASASELMELWNRLYIGRRNQVASVAPTSGSNSRSIRIASHQWAGPGITWVSHGHRMATSRSKDSLTMGCGIFQASLAPGQKSGQPMRENIHGHMEIYIYIDTHLYVYIYIYIYTHLCIYIYTHNILYMYI